MKPTFDITTRLGALLAVLLLAGGCASVGPAPTEAELLQKFVAQTAVADRLLAESRTDEARRLLHELVLEHPSSKEPWLRLARLHFDAGQYGSAISAADEVLQRDPRDRVATSLRAVGGLRVATQSLVALRGDAEITGSTRADAATLARVLREILGEEVLVPPVTATRTPARRAVAPTGRARAASPTSAGTSRPSGLSGDPFSVLK